MSSIERFSRTIPASGVIENPRGNVFLLIAATGTINVRFENGGAAEGVNSVNGGVRVERVKPWDAARILGTPGITVEYWVGSQQVDKDLIDVFTQIAVIAGVAAVAIAPAAAVADNAPVVVPNATLNQVLFAANLTRKRIRVFVDENNPDVCYARLPGGTGNDLANLQPGSVYTFEGKYALNIDHPASGGACTFYLFEEA